MQSADCSYPENRTIRKESRLFEGRRRALANWQHSHSTQNLSIKTLTQRLHVLVEVLGLVHLVLLSFPHGHF